MSGVSCPTESLCVAVGGLDTLAFSQTPTAGAAKWHVVNPPYPIGPGKTCVEGEPHCYEPGGRLNAVSCASQSFCVAVAYEGFVYVSTDPTGGAGSWSFENLVAFRPTEAEGQPPRNALFSASCASTSLCALVGIDGRIFTATDPFSAPDPPSGDRGHKAPLRPRTILVFAEHFWKGSITRHRRIRARFRFYPPTKARGFECKRDRDPYRRCRTAALLG